MIFRRTGVIRLATIATVIASVAVVPVSVAAGTASPEVTTPPPSDPASNPPESPSTPPETPTPSTGPTEPGQSAEPAPSDAVEPPGANEPEPDATQNGINGALGFVSVPQGVIAAQATVQGALAKLDQARSDYDRAAANRATLNDTLSRLTETRQDVAATIDRAAAYVAQSQGSGRGLIQLNELLSSSDLLGGLSRLEQVDHLVDQDAAVKRIQESRKLVAALDEQISTVRSELASAGLETQLAAVDTAQKEVDDARAQLATLSAQLTGGSAAELQSFLQNASAVGPLGWVAPVTGRISSGFGLRIPPPIAGVNEFHAGIDIAAACGTPIVAATSGVVSASGSLGSYGNWILIDHGSGIQTGYGHIADGGLFVRSGAAVSAGQIIAVVGSTGASTGCHLHFEVRNNGVPTDPIPVLAARGINAQ